MISYRPLLDYMYHNDLLMSDVIKDIGISSRTAAKLRKGEPISLQVIETICLHYNLSIEEVVKISIAEEDPIGIE